MKQEFGVEAELIKGDRGIFDVKVDGDLIFSKHAEDRHPEDREIVEIIRARG